MLKLSKTLRIYDCDWPLLWWIRFCVLVPEQTLKSEGRESFLFVYISSSHFLIMNCVICSVVFFHWWFWVSLYCFCSQFSANSCTFAFYSVSMHIVTSHCTFLYVIQLCLIKPFPFHVYDQTSWRLEVKCRWYIYCMHLSETCQKIDLFWYSTILYWPWCMFAICKWQLSELTAWNSNVASSPLSYFGTGSVLLLLSWIGYTGSSVSLTTVWSVSIDVILFVACFHLHNWSVFDGSSDCYFHIGEALCSKYYWSMIWASMSCIYNSPCHMHMRRLKKAMNVGYHWSQQVGFLRDMVSIICGPKVCRSPLVLYKDFW